MRCETTTLSNGVRIVTEEAPGALASIGVFVGSGSRDETDATQGAAKMLESMAFKTSEARSQFGLHHEIEHMGGVLGVTASREDIIYTCDVVKENSASALQAMAENVVNPRLMYHEIEDEKPLIKTKLAAAAENSQLVVTEAAHTAAYGNAGLGRTLAPAYNKIAA